MGRTASADQTGAFDALGEVLLQEDVHDQDGQNGDQAACLHPHDLFSGADICVIEQLLGQQGAQVFQHQRNGLVLGEEGGADIVVVPVPHHREQKDRQERGGCVGDHDLYEGAERTAAVQIGSVLQLLGESLEELAEDEDHESGTDAVAHGCRQVHAELGVDEVDLQPEQSEVPEQHVLGNGDDLGRHEDHHDHDADEVFTSWGVETARKFTKAEVEHALTELDTGNYGMILRSKGIVNGGADGWLEFDYVPGEWEVRARGADVGGKLVVIGSKLNEKAIAELFGC